MTTKQPAIQSIYCPWCHAPLAYISAVTVEGKLGDRYDCAGKPSHTILVLPRLD